MSNDQAKFINSRRRHKNDLAIARQLKIVRQHHIPGTLRSAPERQPHRLIKHHAMDCGNPGCWLCGNPRKTHGKDRLTAQERRLFQDIDQPRRRHSNGSSTKD